MTKPLQLNDNVVITADVNGGEPAMFVSILNDAGETQTSIPLLTHIDDDGVIYAVFEDYVTGNFIKYRADGVYRPLEPHEIT